MPDLAYGKEVITPENSNIAKELQYVIGSGKFFLNLNQREYNFILAIIELLITIILEIVALSVKEFHKSRSIGSDSTLQ